jgi:hypothetical protein
MTYEFPVSDLKAIFYQILSYKYLLGISLYYFYTAPKFPKGTFGV